MLSVVVAFQLALVKIRCKFMTIFTFDDRKGLMCLIERKSNLRTTQFFFKAFLRYVVSATAARDAVCFISTIYNVFHQVQSPIKKFWNRIFLEWISIVARKLTRRRTRRSKALPFFSRYARTGAPTEAWLLYYSWRYYLGWRGAIMVCTRFTARWCYPFDLTVNLKYIKGSIEFDYWHTKVICKYYYNWSDLRHF